MPGPAYIIRMAVIFAAAVVFLGTSLLPIAAINSRTSDWNSAILHRTFHHHSGISELIDGLFALFFCSSCMGVIVVLSLLPALVSVLIAIWMYNDARRRGDPNAVVWALLGLIFNIVGWLIYLIVRGNGPSAAPPVQRPQGSDIPPPGP